MLTDRWINNSRDLIRADLTGLQRAEADLHRESSGMSCLFHNVWHSGIVGADWSDGTD